MSKVRILRIIEYVGEPEALRNHLSNASHGLRVWGHGPHRLEMRSFMVGDVDAVLSPLPEDVEDLTSREGGSHGR